MDMPEEKKISPYDDLLNAPDVATFLDRWNDHSESLKVEQRKNPRYLKRPDCFDDVCCEWLYSDAWTLSESAHLILGYVPDRPELGLQADEEIKALKKHLQRAVGASFEAVQPGNFFKAAKYRNRDVLQWAMAKGFKLSKPLENSVKPVSTPVKAVRKDVRKRVKVQEEARLYYEMKMVDNGKCPSRGQVARYLVNKLDYLMPDEEGKVLGWLKDVDPEREIKQAKYGKK